MLEITNIRVERLQDISEEDTKTEGVRTEFEMNAADFIHGKPLTESTYYLGFKHFWDSINSNFNLWIHNPWVWVIEFKRIGD